MNTLLLLGADSTVDNEALGRVLGVDVVLAADLDGGLTGTVLADLVVLAVVGHSTDATGDGVAGLPVDGEVGAGAILDAVVLLGVLGLARLLVGADSAALGTLVLLGGEVLGVSRTPNTR